MKAIHILLLFIIPLFATAGDTSPAPVRKHPKSEPEPLVPLIQRDAHSCGFLALSALYESYGMNPTAMNLRARLGTDVPLVPFMEDTTGTIQPDVFRVLEQDGFEIAPVKGRDPNSREEIIDHLNSGQYALTLINRRENGNLHWVVLTSYRDDRVTVGDSLRPECYEEPLDDFLVNHIQNVLLLSPKKPNPLAAILPEHMKGAANMLEPWRGPIAGGAAIFLGSFLFWFYRRKKVISLAGKQ